MKRQMRIFSPEPLVVSHGCDAVRVGGVGVLARGLANGLISLINEGSEARGSGR